MSDQVHGGEGAGELERALDALGREERRALHEALVGEPLPEGRAEAALRSSLGIAPVTEDAPAAGRWRVLLAAAVGLAACLAFVLLRGSWKGEGAGEEVWLGAASDALRPAGSVEEFARFSWDVERSEAGWYRVVVRNERFEVLDRSPDLRTRTWEPPRAMHAAWPTRIHWTVEVHRGGDAGASPRSFSQWAERSDSR